MGKGSRVAVLVAAWMVGWMVQPAYAADSDGDGFTDSEETAAGTSPSDPFDFPEPAAGVFVASELSIAADAPQAVLTVDLDSDGDLDIIVASFNDDKIAWYQNDGAGGLTEHIITLTADGARSIAAADLDGDGDLDVVSASQNDNKVSWFENNGSQQFSERIISTAMPQAMYASVADLNGDGELDVLVAAAGSKELFWFENNGQESFAAHRFAYSSYGFDRVHHADMDGDGDADVVAEGYYYGGRGFFIHLNDGFGRFSSKTTVGSLSNKRQYGDFAAGDVDNDGDIDLVFSSNEYDELVMYEITRTSPSITWSRKKISSGIGRLTDIALKDFDGDGDLDVVAVSRGAGAVAWYENLGSWTFLERVIASDIGGASALAAGDVDGDGDQDVLVAAEQSNRITLLRNQVAMDFGDLPPPYAVRLADGGARHLVGSLYLGAAVDAEFDGLSDPQAAGDDQFGQADEDGVVFGHPVLRPNYPESLTVTASQGGGLLSAWIDFNQDGQFVAPEAVFQDEPLQAGANNIELFVPFAPDGVYFARFRVSSHAGLGPTGPSPDGEVEDYAVRIAFDYDGDGVPDSEDAFPDNPAETADSDGDGLGNNADTDDDGDGEPDSTDAFPLDSSETRDTDGDGVGDNADTDDDNDGLPDSFEIANGLNPKSAAGVDGRNGDLDNDGFSNWEEYVGGTAANNPFIFPEPEPAFIERIISGSYVPNSNNYRSSASYDITLGDVDDDGDVDAVIAAGRSGSSVVYWLENSGNQAFTRREIAGPPAAVSTAIWKSPVIKDLDGDGDMDVIAASVIYDDADRNLGGVVWFENDGAENFSQRMVFSGAARVATIHIVDLDGDGDLDVLSGQRESAGRLRWHEQLSKGVFTAHLLETGPDNRGSYESIATADFDQDGDLDIAISGRDRSIYWYVNDGAENFVVESIGASLSLSSAIIQVADLDGDGDLDIVADGAGQTSVGRLYWFERLQRDDGVWVYREHQISHESTPQFSAGTLKLVDIDNDGDLDILRSVILNWGDQLGEASWWVNDGAQNFTGHVLSNNPIFGSDVADLDGDGDLDLVATMGVNDNAILWLDHQGGMDFGDAATGFPVTRTDNGARHLVGHLYLGARIDSSYDGASSADAGADDRFFLADEDGVEFSNAVLVPGQSNPVTVTASAGNGLLSGWIDYNQDGDWLDAGEQVFADVPLAAGANALSITAPGGLADGLRMARFRLTAHAGLGFTGPSPDGEVEDYQLAIGQDSDGDGVLDAMDPCPNDAAGTTDTDGDGICDYADTDDDNDGTPDASDRFPLDPNETADNDGDGLGDNADTDDDNDGLPDSYESANGLNPRSASGDDGPNGDPDGDGYSNQAEYEANTSANTPFSFPESGDFDYGDAPLGYPVLKANNGARHKVGAIKLGAQIDASADGVHSADALGDDQAGVDDEDGVTFGHSPLRPGVTETVTVVSSHDSVYLSAWIDYNQNGSWSDAGEQVFADQALTAGNNVLNLTIPAELVEGTRYARFRVTTHLGQPIDGPSLDGEVEDYAVLIAADADGDGSPDSADAFPNDPTEDTDTDGDGIGNNQDPDDDGDGEPDVSDAFPLDSSETNDSDGDGIGDNADTDDDNDGMPDSYEIANGLNEKSASGEDGASGDPDGDGFTNFQEYLDGTKANNPFSFKAQPGAFVGVSLSHESSYSQVIAVSDFNQDGAEDIVFENNSGQIVLLEAPAIDSGLSDFSEHEVARLVSGVESIFLADIDGDEDLDVLTASQSLDTIAWHENMGGWQFTSHVISDTADGAKRAIAADIDGDGDLDVVAASTYDNTVSWFENNGDGTFSDAQVVSDNVQRAFAVTAADIDGDGDADIVAAGSTSGVIAFKNNGAQSFSSNVFWGGSLVSGSLELVDIDADGDLDLLSAAQSGAEPVYFVNDGSGNFSWVSFGFDDRVTWVLAADLDGDGDQDIALANINYEIVWYQNDGSGLFSRYLIASELGYQQSIAAGDIDGDGDVDLVGTQLNSGGQLYVFKNVGSLDFGDAPDGYSVTASEDGARHVPSSLRLGALFDASFDGVHSADALGDDRLFVDDEDGIYLGHPILRPGETETVSVVASEAGGLLSAWIDYNQDLDWLDAGERVLTNVPLQAGANALNIDIPAGLSAGLRNARFRISRFADIPVSGPSPDGEVEDYQFLIDADTDGDGIPNSSDPDDDNDGTPDTSDAFPLDASESADNDGDGIGDNADPDDDNDGMTDSYELAHGLNPKSAAGNDGADGDPDGDGFTNAQEFAAGTDPHDLTDIPPPNGFTAQLLAGNGSYTAIRAADLNGDGLQDVVTASFSSHQIVWHRRQNNGDLLESVIDDAATGAYGLSLVDLDDDGDIDVLAALRGASDFVWYRNDGGGLFSRHLIADFAHGAQVIASGDLDGDGDIDVLVGSQQDVLLAWLENDGSEGFTLHVIDDQVNGIIDVKLIDLDGDSDLDVVAAYAHSNQVLWFENLGSQVFDVRTIDSTLSTPTGVAVADMDADGDLDVVTSSLNDDTVAWHQNDGAQQFNRQVLSIAVDGARGIWVADVDGDGRADVVAPAFNADSLYWFRNAGGGNFESALIESSLYQAASVYVADVDGDGDNDVLAGGRYHINWYENLRGLDFGDAPAGYPVTLAENGARHVRGALYLGAAIDVSFDGSHSNDALGDDQFWRDDEDGLSFGHVLLRPGTNEALTVEASQSGGVLSVWIDFNQDQDWNDAGEQVLTDQPLAAGSNALQIAVPQGLTDGYRFLRARFSTATGLLPHGAAPDGEVEDYRVLVAVDTDADGDPNTSDPDDDNDGTPDGSDAFPLDASESADHDGDGIGDNADPDDDNDGLPDSYEVANGLNPRSASGADGASGDPDGDGLSNSEEYANGTNPQAAETSSKERDLLLSPRLRRFGVETINAADCQASSRPVEFVIENFGANAASIGAIGFEGPQADQYVLATGSDNCSNRALPAASDCRFSVLLCPSSGGNKAAVLTVETDDVETPKLTAALYNYEATKEEAERRMPPVMSAFSLTNSANAPVTDGQLVEGETYTLSWEITGYHADYSSMVALFDCSSAAAGACGNNYGENRLSSGLLDNPTIGAGAWTFNGMTSKTYTFQYSFTAWAVDADTEIVLRFFSKTAADQEAGNGSVSLLVPGNLASRYYGTTGRRLSLTIRDQP